MVQHPVQLTEAAPDQPEPCVEQLQPSSPSRYRGTREGWQEAAVPALTPRWLGSERHLEKEQIMTRLGISLKIKQVRKR